MAGRARSGRAIRAYALLVGATVLLFVADGSRQPTSGQGWRLLGSQRGIVGPDVVVPITSQAQLDDTWDRMRIRTAPARLPTDATVFWVTATGSIGCPAHLAGMRTDTAGVTVIFTRALTAGCDTLRVPDSFLVAIDRSRLPDGPFSVARTGPSGEPDTVVAIRP